MTNTAISNTPSNTSTTGSGMGRLGKWMLATLGLAVCYMIVKSAPDVARYIKISTM